MRKFSSPAAVIAAIFFFAAFGGRCHGHEAGGAPFGVLMESVDGVLGEPGKGFTFRGADGHETDLVCSCPWVSLGDTVSGARRC